MATLLIFGPGGEVLRSVDLGQERVSIGRGHDVDIPLDDPSVSRRHATIVKGPSGYTIVAEGERAIVFRGERHGELALSDGMRFRLGNTELGLADHRTAATVTMEAVPRAGAPPSAPRPPAASGLDEPISPPTRAPAASDPDEPISLPPSGASRALRALAILIVFLGGAAAAAYFLVDDDQRATLMAWLGVGSGPADAGTAHAGADGGAGAGPGLDVELAEPGPLYELDRQTSSFDLPLAGDNGALAGELADGDGRRRITYRPRPGAPVETVFEAAFNLPAVGAAVGGTLVVCANRLIGRPSSLTEGEMPDPRDGVELRCRARTSSGWGDEHVLPSPDAAPWLVELRPGATGLEVRFARDSSSSLVNDPAAGDGLFAVSYGAGGFGAPSLIEAARGPVTPVQP